MDPQPLIPMNPPPPPPTPATSSAIATATSAGTAAEPPQPNQIAQVANPTPHHPPYAEMITAAITALKDRNGSSRTAIAKYIDRVYTNLPSSHSSLLTTYLKRLKKSGQVVMVKHSYKLPSRSASSPSLNNAAITAAGSSSSSLAQPKKRPGRPSKSKPISFMPAQAQIYNDVGFVHPPQSFLCENYNVTSGSEARNQYQNFAVGSAPVVQKRKPGRPAKPKPGVAPLDQNAAVPPPAQYFLSPPVVQNTTLPPVAVPGNGGSEAMFVSLGLADAPPAAAATAPVKRPPGRPRKGDSACPRQPTSRPLNQSRPRRKPGRQTRNVAGAVPNSGVPVGSVSGKPRGRPKGVSLAVASEQPNRRGRLPKNVPPVSAAAVVPPSGVVVPKAEASAAVTNPVMVPYAQVPVAGPCDVAHMPFQVPLAGNGVPPPASGKRRGRPPRANGVPNKRRNTSGKPPGRPRKAVSPSDMQQHLSAFVDLQNKLDYLKLKIKQAVNVIKPCIEAGTSACAMVALQQLEELANMVVNDGPVNVQGEQAVQQD